MAKMLMFSPKVAGHADIGVEEIESTVGGPVNEIHIPELNVVIFFNKDGNDLYKGVNDLPKNFLATSFVKILFALGNSQNMINFTLRGVVLVCGFDEGVKDLSKEAFTVFDLLKESSERQKEIWSRTGKKQSKNYGIYYWDTFDNETEFVGEEDTIDKAINFVKVVYGRQINPNGADRIDIVDISGNLVECYQVS